MVAKREASRSGTRQRASAAPAGLEIAFKVEPGRSTTTIGDEVGDQAPVTPEMELAKIVGAHDPDEMDARRAALEPAQACHK